jgi:hypothetical protein
MMKKFLILAIITLSMSLVAFGNNAMSVKDYFLAIPQEYMKADKEKRTSWITTDSVDDGYLEYTIPAAELGVTKEQGRAYGNVQVFEKKDGGVIVGLTTNMCSDGACQGQVLFLDYKAGKFEDVSSDLAPQPDNDEVIKILREAPAFGKKDSLKDGEQVPLSITFSGTNKLIQFTAGETEKISDSGVVSLMFKWNGETFTEFKYEESPE